VVKASGMKVN